MKSGIPCKAGRSHNSVLCFNRENQHNTLQENEHLLRGFNITAYQKLSFKMTKRVLLALAWHNKLTSSPPECEGGKPFSHHKCLNFTQEIRSKGTEQGYNNVNYDHFALFTL